MSFQNIIFGNLPQFPVDASTGQRLVTLGDLEAAFAGLTATVESPSPPVWLHRQLDYTDLAAAATTNNVEIFELPAGAMIMGSIIKHATAFAGGSLSSYTVSLGITGTLTKFAAAEDVFQAVADGTFQWTNYTGGPESMGGAAVSIRAAATGSHNLDTATAGVVDIYLLISQVFEAV